MPTIIAGAVGAQSKNKEKSNATSHKKRPGESGGKAKVKVYFRKAKEEECVSLSLLSTMHKLEKVEYEQKWQDMTKNSKERTQEQNQK